MSGLSVRRALFREDSYEIDQRLDDHINQTQDNRINQEPFIEPINLNPILIEEEKPKEEDVTLQVFNPDLPQVREGSEDEIQNNLASEHVTGETKQNDEQPNTPSMNPSIVGIAEVTGLPEDESRINKTQKQEVEILMTVSQNKLEEVLENKEVKFSLSSVVQTATGMFHRLMSFFSFNREKKQENKKEIDEVQKAEQDPILKVEEEKVEELKVEEHKVEEFSENLRKIVDKLPKSLLDKLNEVSDKEKFKKVFSMALARYEAVINSSARKYSKLTAEEKTDEALQQGARIISDALNSLR